MRFLDLMPKLHAFAKSIKDLATWHDQVAHFRYKNLLWMSKYVFGIEKVITLAPNKICE